MAEDSKAKKVTEPYTCIHCSAIVEMPIKEDDEGEELRNASQKTKQKSIHTSLEGTILLNNFIVH